MSPKVEVAPALDSASVARLQGEHEAQKFECEMLRHETRRLMALNRTLEARLALAEGERDRVKAYLKLIEQSRPWKIAQTVRGWFGRQW